MHYNNNCAGPHCGDSPEQMISPAGIGIDDRDTSKAGPWTVDWTMDWTMDRNVLGYMMPECMLSLHRSTPCAHTVRLLCNR